MHPMVEMDLVKAIYRDRLQTAERHRLAARVRREAAAARRIDEVVIRKAAKADARGLERLAQLDEAPVPAGPTLVAEVDGRLVAALPLDGGRPVADPFVASAPVVKLLQVRAAQVSAVV